MRRQSILLNSKFETFWTKYQTVKENQLLWLFNCQWILKHFSQFVYRLRCIIRNYRLKSIPEQAFKNCKLKWRGNESYGLSIVRSVLIYFMRYPKNAHSMLERMNFRVYADGQKTNQFRKVSRELVRKCIFWNSSNFMKQSEAIEH